MHFSLCRSTSRHLPWRIYQRTVVRLCEVSWSGLWKESQRRGALPQTSCMRRPSTLHEKTSLAAGVWTLLLETAHTHSYANTVRWLIARKVNTDMHTGTSCRSSYLHSFTFSLVILDSSTLYTEDSGPFKRKGSLYVDLGALAGYYNLVRGPPTAEYG